MAAANDTQMQVYASERLRPRAEQFRNLRESCLDDVAAIDSVYERAISANRWTDNRSDGPPKLLISGNSANPDDMLNYNSFIQLFEKFMSGTFANVGEANSAAALWQVVRDACVRPSN
jgi:uncharacterized protein